LPYVRPSNASPGLQSPVVKHFEKLLTLWRRFCKVSVRPTEAPKTKTESGLRLHMLTRLLTKFQVEVRLHRLPRIRAISNKKK